MSHTGFDSTMSSCKARHFCHRYGEHWNFERCILGGWMRMGLQNWVITVVVCGVSWNVGSGWVGTHAWCNMESCSGKVQKRDVWDENLGVWGFVVCLWNVGSGWVGTHAWCNLFRVVPAKIKTEMCEMKILGSELLWCIFGTLVQDGWHTCVV